MSECLCPLLLPLHRPPPAPCHKHSKQRWRWYRSHLRSNGSTSSSRTADHPRQTFCREKPWHGITWPHLWVPPKPGRGADSLLNNTLMSWMDLLTWNEDLCGRTWSRWYRWFSLGSGARPAPWECSRAGPASPGHLGSCKENPSCDINSALCFAIRKMASETDTTANKTVLVLVSTSVTVLEYCMKAITVIVSV